MNDYFKKIYKENNIKSSKVDLSYTKDKEKYLNNFILNAIVNHARYNYKNKDTISSKDVIQAMANKVYRRNRKLNRRQIVINSLSNIYTNKAEIMNAVKSINNKIEQASEYYRLKRLEESKDISI